MKRLLILSGKGGTGKTTISSAFIKLAKARAFADCDVDAPNLHLILANGKQPQHTPFYGMPKAYIEPERCTSCGTCLQKCRFHAIHKEGCSYRVDPFACESCGLCSRICPSHTIHMTTSAAGDLMLYQNSRHIFSTTQLYMGSGTSGKLVTQVKQQMTAAAPADTPLAVIDGSPGIGCPVIASISGVDMVLIVTEPSLSGLSDLKRILKTAAQFEARVAVCINKYDTNLEITRKIECFCNNNQIPVMGKIPFDENAGKAINQGLSVVDLPCPAQKMVTAVYTEVMRLMEVPAVSS